jgi:ADP-heptose:LPS heptosyltransferase
MLTAAVRDLHVSYPGRFLTDVRTSCPALWENNPYITKLDDTDFNATTIQCTYPLIYQSDTLPYHFIHGFIEHLNEQLDTHVRPSAFCGDIHLSQQELTDAPMLQQLTSSMDPYWIVAAGGKYDYTIKWWDPRRFQQVIDFYAGRVRFVQVGERHHHHPPLRGVIDLRGRTDLRQLIRLVYHASGILTPVSLLMHLAAAVPSPPGFPRSRPCVVIAGGREPTQWEAYPPHQYLHTIGALPCCETGGCWRSRTIPLLDGSDNDLPDRLCLNVIGYLPRCMDLITASDVINRIELYRART